jgi:cytidylate kinase
MQLLNLSESQAREKLDYNDDARTAYVRHFYRTDPASCEHYDLVLDSTRLSLEACTELIVTAAKAAHPVG